MLEEDIDEESNNEEEVEKSAMIRAASLSATGEVGPDGVSWRCKLGSNAGNATVSLKSPGVIMIPSEELDRGRGGVALQTKFPQGTSHVR